MKMEGFKNNKTGNSPGTASWVTIFFSRLKWNVVNTFTNLIESKRGLSILYLVVTFIFLITMIIEEIEGSY